VHFVGLYYASRTYKFNRNQFDLPKCNTLVWVSESHPSCHVKIRSRRDSCQSNKTWGPSTEGSYNSVLCMVQKTDECRARYNMAPLGGSTIQYGTTRWQHDTTWYHQVAARYTMAPPGGSTMQHCTTRWQHDTTGHHKVAALLQAKLTL
jgi:hypothetical protein